jgi:YD repeat-containing protein
VTEYNALGQVSRTADLAGNSTLYEYYTTGSGTGKLKKVTHADGAYTEYVYDLHGRVTEQTGSADYPVRYTYHSTDGWMTEMKTYRDTSTQGNPLTGTSTYQSLSTWTYDSATGLLTDKTDHNSKSTSYTYWTGTTLLKERKWARIVTGTTRNTTTHNYDAAGRLVKTEYNDGTLPVVRTYDRAGREATREDAAGKTTITYSAGGVATSEAITATTAGGDPDLLAGWTLSRTVETSTGRLSGIDGTWSAAGLSANNGVVTAAYAYNSTTGRLDTVMNNSRPVVFSYAANSDQPALRQFKDNASNVLFEQEYGYDESGRLNAAITRDVSPATTHTAYYYQYDNRNRRTQAVREDGVQWNYGYDARGHVTSAKMKNGSAFLAGRQPHRGQDRRRHQWRQPADDFLHRQRA